MGIVYNNSSNSINRDDLFSIYSSRFRQTESATSLSSRNVEFLQSLGLRVNPFGGKTEKNIETIAAESLNIYSPVMYDESVINYEIHSYQPYNFSLFLNNDENCIAIQNQDLNALPFRSSLRIVGQISKKDRTPVARTWLTNNAIMFLFEKNCLQAKWRRNRLLPSCGSDHSHEGFGLIRKWAEQYTPEQWMDEVRG